MQSLRERRSSRSSNPQGSVPSLNIETSSNKKIRSNFPRGLTACPPCTIIQSLLNVVLFLLVFRFHSFHVTSNVTKSQGEFAHQRLLPATSPTSRSTSLQSFDFHITIYAFDRPQHLLNLLRDIARESNLAKLKIGVHVIDDNSYGCQFDPIPRNIFQQGPDQYPSNPEDVLVRVPLPSTLPCAASYRFSAVENFIYANNWTLFVSKYRHSRRRLWHLVRYAHALLRSIDAQFFLFLPDDDRLSHNFFPTVSKFWHSISDPRKLTLMLHVEESRENVSVWTTFHPRPLGNNLTRIGWVESGNFVTTRSFLQFFNWSFPCIPIQRWIDNPPISSGVGATMSSLIHGAHFHMYRTDYSLVAHVGVTLSKMNAQFRLRNVPSLVTKRFIDGDPAYESLLASAATVTASIASHWVREASLHSAVVSLATQVDRLNVYLNGYEYTPVFLLAPFISVIRSDDPYSFGDIGDIGKFYWCNNLSTEFHITADDDILYPDNYVEKLLAFRRTMKSPVIVGVHGIRLKQDLLRPSPGARGKGYYASRDVWMSTEHVASPVTVHILGTGTMLYKASEVGHIDLLKVFQKANMADIWFGILAQKLRIPMVVMQHDAEWLREVPGTFEDSIYKKSTRRRYSDRSQTQAVLTVNPWQLFSPVFQPNVP